MMFLALLAYSSVLRVSCTGQRHSSLANTLTLESSLTSLKISGFHLRKNRTHFQVGGGRRHGGDD